MQRMITRGLMAMAFVSVLSSQAWAASPNLDYQMTLGVESGVLSDGTVLGRGSVSYTSPHLGFRVWSDVDKSGAQAGRYRLSGLHQPQNTLRVRLEQEGWHADEEGGKGIVIHTGVERVEFRVVVDGTQKVAADNWALPLKANTLLP